MFRRFLSVLALALAFAGTPALRLATVAAPASIVFAVSSAHAQSPYPLGNIWELGDSKIWGVTDPPGSCGPRDPQYPFISSAGGAFVGTLVGGADNGAQLTPCPITGLPLLSDGHSGYHISDIISGYAGWYGSISAPNRVILHIGTNDLLAIQAGVSGWTMDKLTSDFATLMADLMALLPQSTPLFVSNMDPMPGIYFIPQFTPYNEFIKAQVKQYQRQGRLVYLIDVYGGSGMVPIANPTAGACYNSGNVHENLFGYSLKGLWFNHAMQTLKP